jgi:hypothetical protein
MDSAGQSLSLGAVRHGSKHVYPLTNQWKASVSPKE